MENDSHQSIWNNFSKFVLWATIIVFAVLAFMAIFLL